MAKRQTAEVANSKIFDGEKLYQKRARLTLPYLVRQAKAGKTIYYSALAEEIGIPNPRNLNYILGAIGNALIDLGKRTKTDIPSIQCLVVNKQQELPGDGIGGFINIDFGNLNKAQKRRVVDLQLAQIYSFPHWDWVLQQLELAPVSIHLGNELEEARHGAGGGENEQHKQFKEFISRNPYLLGLSKDLANGQQEYALPSADKIDVLFVDEGLKIGVEVKSSTSNTADILRGIFQCVKYKYLIEAEQVVKNELPDSRIILALQGQFPPELILAKNLLGVEVIDRIKSK